MRSLRYQSALSFGGLGVALALLVVGATRVHSVWTDPGLNPPKPIEAGPDGQGLTMVALPPSLPESKEMRLSDLRMVENATFTGVVRREDGFYFTYNPNEKRGKRGCPT